MDYQPFKIKDLRIHLTTFQTEDNKVEIYPLGSFTFEYFIYFEFNFNYIYTTTTNTSNTFFFHINQNKIYNNIKAISTARTGQSSGFFFYESTLWKNQKNQKQVLPLTLLTHCINYFNNVRWVFLSSINNNQINSLSNIYPAATWSEREMQDMFCVKFINLKDTRRLLLEYKTKRGVLNNNYKLDFLPKFSSYYDLYYI